MSAKAPVRRSSYPSFTANLVALLVLISAIIIANNAVKSRAKEEPKTLSVNSKETPPSAPLAAPVPEAPVEEKIVLKEIVLSKEEVKILPVKKTKRAAFKSVKKTERSAADDLDNELARQRYLEENAHAFKPTAPASAPQISSDDDLDSAAQRHKYLEENKKISGRIININ